jgi:hypothetical protein
MFGSVTSMDGRQFIEMAKYNHLRSFEGQDLKNEHTIIIYIPLGSLLALS